MCLMICSLDIANFCEYVRAKIRSCKVTCERVWNGTFESF